MDRSRFGREEEEDEKIDRSKEPQRRIFPSLIGLSILVAVGSVLLLRLVSNRTRFQPVISKSDILGIKFDHESFSELLERFLVCGDQRMWAVKELAPYNGTDENLPILLGILG
ncbi:hypothetical protein KSP39_PZI005403 [Platanthera zijinensis]|uniref:Uncharacterized protein n=1 Tax=Platanthera zijinensis TaxID=2320716 RepID=A0AAP0BRR6_9ASPA